MTQLLKFEKEILIQTTNTNHLLILAEGLNLINIIRHELTFYDHSYTLTILINFNDLQINFLSKFLKIQNLNNLSSKERNKKYLLGGIFYVTQRVFITDLLNTNISISKISAVFTNSVDKLNSNSTECFINSVIRNENKDCIFKCYTEKSTYFVTGVIFLDEIMQALKLDKLVLIPRFHCSVQESLINSGITEHRLVLNRKIHELQILLFEIIQSLAKEYQIFIKKEVSAEFLLSMDNINLSFTNFRGMQLEKDISNIKKLVYLLYSVDFELFFELYNLLFEEQKQTKGTWIAITASHLLLEKATLYLNEERKIKCDLENTKETDCLEVKDNVGENLTRKSTELLSGFQETCDLQSKKLKQEGKSTEFTNINPETCDLKPKNLKQELIEDRDTIFPEYEINDEFKMENLKKVNKNFYNSKLNLLLKLIEKYKTKKICILSKSKDIVTNLSKDLNNCYGFSHYEFKFIDFDYEVVIMLDPSLSSIRKLELIATTNEIQIDLLIFKESLEEQSYLLAIRKEKESFEKLIELRSKQALFFYEQEQLNEKVLVDVRELRATLPFSFYKQGFQIQIATLNIGDYFFKKICIERKEIFDLISSINSGRLFNQINQLSSVFIRPILLIEFPHKIDLVDHLKKHLIVKFLILLINFPSLNVIYSNSDIFTVKVLNSIESVENEKNLVVQADPDLLELLFSIDGVNLKNVKFVLERFDCLKELVDAKKDDLVELLGSVNGDKVFEFFNEPL